MKIDIPEPTEEERKKYDGATLVFKDLMVKIWGQDQIDLVIECGFIHDDLTVDFPNRFLQNRLLFYIKMARNGVKPSLIRVISIFLFSYDILPTQIKWLIDVITKKPEHRN